MGSHLRNYSLGVKERSTILSSRLLTQKGARSSVMETDPRDELWEISFETFYESSYEEIVADCLVKRWQLLDEVAKISLAVTVSGSAVSGWALWGEPYFKGMWAVLAAIAAVISIVHVTLRVPSRLEDWVEIKRYFAHLRIELETFRYRMQVDPEFSMKEFTDTFLGYRKSYAEGISRLKNDILLTRRLEFKAQDYLDERLADKIIKENGDQ